MDSEIFNRLTAHGVTSVEISTTEHGKIERLQLFKEDDEIYGPAFDVILEHAVFRELTDWLGRFVRTAAYLKKPTEVEVRIDLNRRLVEMVMTRRHVEILVQALEA